MQDFSPPPIVQDRDNGLAYLRALCNLFNAPFDRIAEEDQMTALQLFGGLYLYPAIEEGSLRVSTMRELDDLMNQYFPLDPPDGAWAAMKEGFADGLALNWGTESATVRGAYARVRAEMIVYRNKWRDLTMGDPDDLITGYRWRSVVTGVFAAIGGIAGTLTVTEFAAGTAAKGLEGYIPNRSIRDGARAAAQRALAGGSGPAQVLTRGRGVAALATRGGVAGIMGVYGLTYTYAVIESEEDDIRDAITLRVLSGELDESYIDQMNAPIDYVGAIEGIKWW